MKKNPWIFHFHIVPSLSVANSSPTCRGAGTGVWVEVVLNPPALFGLKKPHIDNFMQSKLYYANVSQIEGDTTGQCSRK